MSRTNPMKNAIASAYGNVIDKVSLHSGDPGSSGVNELSGGSPAYARISRPSFTAPTTGLITFTVTFDVEAGDTVGGAGFWDSSGNFLDGGVVTPQTFSSQGTYTLTVTCQAN